MAPLKLYGARYSTCTQRVLLVLNELNIPFEESPIDMMKGAHKDPTYVSQLHPFGRIPAIEDDGFKVFESKAICRYLVAKNGKGSSELLPSQDAKALAVFEQAASVEASYFDPAITQLAYEKMFKSMMGHGDADPATVKQLEAKLTESLDYYQDLLSKQKFLGGDNFTLVDLFHMPWIAMLPKVGLNDAVSSRSKLQAWWSTVQTRKSWESLQH